MKTYFRHHRQPGPVNALQMRLQGGPKSVSLKTASGLPFVALQCSSLMT